MAWNKDGGNARLQPNGEVDNTLRGVRERPGTAASHSKLDAQSLYSEDFQDGQTIDGQLTIRNPFAQPSGG